MSAISIFERERARKAVAGLRRLGRDEQANTIAVLLHSEGDTAHAMLLGATAHAEALIESKAPPTTHERVGTKPLWRHRGLQLPAYIQHVANDLIESGHPESQAIGMAVGIVKNWAAGHDGHGNKVHADTQAAAAAAIAEWEKLKAEAHALSAGKRKKG